MRSVSRRAFLASAGVFAAALAWPRIAAAGTKTVDIAIKNGKVVGARSVRMTQGDTVIMRWTSDKPMELHLHGYDVTAEVEPGTTAVMRIDAHATGRFPVTSHGFHGDKGKAGHGHHKALIYLEVHPR